MRLNQNALYGHISNMFVLDITLFRMILSSYHLEWYVADT